MKKYILSLFILLLSVTGFSQRSSGIVIPQGVIQVLNANNYVTVDTTVAGNFMWRLSRKDSIMWMPWNIKWLNDTVIAVGNRIYPQLSGSYPDASFIPSLAASKVFGLSNVALTGAYSDLSGTPNLSLYYLASNPNGYINASAITSSFINGVYGYTPQAQLNGTGFVKAIGTTISYDNSTYLTGITSGMVNTALGYTPYNGVTNPNGYLTAEVDGSVTNELQTLSISGRTVSLTNGGSVMVPYPAYDSLTGKPTIPASGNITGGQNTKVTGAWPNITISDSLTGKLYNSSGLVNQGMKVWCDTLTPNVSNNFSINISNAGFTRILSANVVAIRNTTSAATVPNAAIKTISTTAITCNIVEDNPATISILGISVLSGLPSIFANVSGLQLAVTVIGY